MKWPNAVRECIRPVIRGHADRLPGARSRACGSSGHRTVPDPSRRVGKGPADGSAVAYDTLQGGRPYEMDHV
ncbi:hypothetical protein GCM10010518_34160 [Kitasatospora cinereorecta]